MKRRRSVFLTTTAQIADNQAMQWNVNGVPVFPLNQDHSRHFRPLIAGDYEVLDLQVTVATVFDIFLGLHFWFAF